MINVFEGNYSKRVLLSYLPSAFDLTTSKIRHTNLLECRAAGEIFDNLGYQVDIIHYGIDCEIDWSRYDVVYGMGWALEKSFYCDRAEQIKKIFYATGCSPFYSDLVTLKRVADFYAENGVLLPASSRLLHNNWKCQVLLSDAVIVLGNEFVLSTYRANNVFSDLYLLRAFYLDGDLKGGLISDFSERKKHFLWFGSGGLIHKGLDVVIEYFSCHANLKLHICGASQSESKFFRYYHDTFDRCDNIIDHGFVDVKSKLFSQLMTLCGAVVLPSVSEGGAAAVLTVIANGGLVPIITYASGLDLYENSIMIEEVDLHGVSQAIEKLLEIPEVKLKEIAFSVKSYVRANYSYKKYKENLKNIIIKSIN